MSEVAKRLGFGDAFDFNSAADVFREHAALSAFENGGSRSFDIGALTSLSDDAFDAMAPVQWPARQDASPQKRFFAEGGFASTTARRGSSRPVPALKTETSAARPLRLNTGRIRDQWHTMTRTGASPRLGQHCQALRRDLHPDDALKYGVTDESFTRITTDYGQCTLKVVVCERQQRGMLFAPIHWSEANATRPASARWWPHTPIRSPASPRTRRPSRRSRHTNTSSAASYCRASHLHCPPMPGRRASPSPAAISVRRQCRPRRMAIWLKSIAGADLAEYNDFGGGIYRGASFAGSRIDACLFVGPAGDADDWNVVKSLFAADSLGDGQRRMLLSGKSADGLADAGPIVCACFGVGRTTICDAIAAGSHTAAEIGVRPESRHQLRFLHSG